MMKSTVVQWGRSNVQDRERKFDEPLEEAFDLWGLLTTSSKLTFDSWLMPLALNRWSVSKWSRELHWAIKLAMTAKQ